jgi:hypothetical protein
MMTATENIHGGLSSLAETLQIERIGPMHQAGSDSLLTALTFFGLIKKFFGGVCDDSRFKGELYGLGTNHTKYKSAKYSSNPNGNGNNNNSSNATAQSNHPQLQFSATVHYPANLQMNLTQSPATTAFGYEEGY